MRNQGNGAWGQLWTQGGRVQGPESGLPGPTSRQFPRKKRRWAPRAEALFRNKNRPLGLHSAWATSWGARVWCTGWVLQQQQDLVCIKALLGSEAQVVKNPPAMQETQVHFLGQEDPLEKGMATHSSMLVWNIL